MNPQFVRTTVEWDATKAIECPFGFGLLLA
jgi:hypothetical protein